MLSSCGAARTLASSARVRAASPPTFSPRRQPLAEEKTLARMVGGDEGLGGDDEDGTAARMKPRRRRSYCGGWREEGEGERDDGPDGANWKKKVGLRRE